VFRIVSEPIDVEAVRRAVGTDGDGAVVLFLGTVRAETRGRAVTRLDYEAYEPMALRQMRAIADEAKRQHGLSGIACVHRVGTLGVGDVAMALAVASPHRGAALEAVADYVRRLKQDVPIWKREHFQDGAVWVGSPEDPQGERGVAGEGR
jgi:molybdopterin synthase catalytic subunit